MCRNVRVDMFPQTERSQWICSHKRELAFDRLPVISCHPVCGNIAVFKMLK